MSIYLIFMRILVRDNITIITRSGCYTWSILARLPAPDLSSVLSTKERSERRESSTMEAAKEVFSLAVLNLFLELLKLKQ